MSRSSRTHLHSPAPPTSRTAMSLLQDVLRHQTLDSIERRFDTTHPDSDGSDEELVNVVCPPGSDVFCPRLIHSADVHTGYTLTVPSID